MKNKITPMLWFDTQAEEAVKFYTGIFKNSKVGLISHYGKNMPMPEGTVMTVSFELDGQLYTALNAGPAFKFNEAISLVVHCDTQQEIDYYWEKLTADGGKPVQCGWLKDKYGLSWQVTPADWPEFHRDAAVSARVMQAMMEMVKLDIGVLRQAAKGA